MIKKPWRMGSTKPLVTFEVLSTHMGWFSYQSLRTEDLLSAEPGITEKESESTQTSELRIRREWVFSWCILILVGIMWNQVCLCSSDLTEDSFRFPEIVKATLNLEVMKKQYNLFVVHNDYGHSWNIWWEIGLYFLLRILFSYALTLKQTTLVPAERGTSMTDF